MATARCLMVMGTGSDVGKSLLVAGLARIARRRGLTVRPFKPQNMSNNAAVTADGGEIGRAQALQARACGAALSVHMNPVLLKPQTDIGAQVVVQGRMAGTARAAEYRGWRDRLMPRVLESFHILTDQADLVLIEGAGSVSEVNLRAGDIANMGFATAVQAPVVLAGDIDRGGVIAQMVGSHMLLPPDERALIKGFIINRFRGDVRLFDGGLDEIRRRTGWTAFGVVPWLPAAARLPAEDAVALDMPGGPGPGGLKIAVPMLSRIANFDDLDPLKLEPQVALTMVPPGQPLPVADLIILPGSKATIGDLAFFRAQGWDIDLAAHVRRGGRVIGICGGYQMLGRSISDPEGIEGEPGHVAGLGLLDIHTRLGGDKSLIEATGTDRITGAAVHGYEMHIGVTTGPDCARPMLMLAGQPGVAERADGAVGHDGRVTGCYLHGLFGADGYRAALIEALTGRRPAPVDYQRSVDQALDALADHLEANLDIEALFAAAARPVRP
ncbi:cobyric acid synthase [Tistrella bauzanensis]|uniref:Cobyric acid synthase n=1 Tax=Tistrella bauzanensis TaxID=657419 RepID=A0ABQ1IKG0_9PROT|nr:cobyric acid synthase [Tistrella bauzanensis]GGB43530.1 cobyric acid synthase [Tistrella bauzanensis]